MEEFGSFYGTGPVQWLERDSRCADTALEDALLAPWMGNRPHGNSSGITQVLVIIRNKDDLVGMCDSPEHVHVKAWNARSISLFYLES